jgi:hypothetical protein
MCYYKFAVIAELQMAYSIDLRLKVLAYIKQHKNRKSASQLFGIHINTIDRWLKMEKDGCLADPKPHRPWKKIDADKLLEAVKANPGKTLSYFAEVFKVKTSSMFNAFKVLKITRKKRLICTESETKKSVEYFWQRSPNSARKS